MTSSRFVSYLALVLLGTTAKHSVAQDDLLDLDLSELSAIEAQPTATLTTHSAIAVGQLNSWTVGQLDTQSKPHTSRRVRVAER